MNEEIKLLINNFKRVSEKGYIKSISKSFGSIGLTFEKELNKKTDSLYFPDYYGIELKCTSRYSRYPLFLFTVAFDGPTFPEINRIVEKYGYPDKDYPDKNVLFTKLFCKEDIIVNDKYKFRLEVDSLQEKLYLCVFDLFDNLIEKKSFVYMQSLYNHLCIKLQTIALIHASIKKYNDEKYFRYYSICIYKLINFEKFIELLKSDELEVELISRISKSGTDKGRYRNKNLVFGIKKSKIDLLFNKIYSYNTDYKIKANS